MQGPLLLLLHGFTVSQLLTSGTHLSFRPPIVGVAGWRTLQLVTEDNLFRQFVARNVTTGLGEDYLGVRLLTVGQLDNRNDFAAPPGAGATRHHDVVDGGVLCDRGLDLFGENL